MVKYIDKICSAFFFIYDIRLLSFNKRKGDLISTDTKLQSSIVKSIESAVCQVTCVDNGKYCVCLRNNKASLMSDYSSELMFLN